MAAHINLVILGGNLTRDVEMRYSAKGTAIGAFGMAVNRKWRDADGAMQEEVSFLDCVAFGKTAENISQYFAKGAAILIEGRLKQDRWEDKVDGRPRNKLQVIVEKFHFVSVREKGAANEGAEYPPRKPQKTPMTAPAAAAAGAEPDDDDDNVPF